MLNCKLHAPIFYKSVNQHQKSSVAPPFKNEIELPNPTAFRLYQAAKWAETDEEQKEKS